MSRFLGIFSVVLVVLLAMAFAAANAGHRVTLSLGILTLYRVPVTLVAFGGLLVGMLVMFATGIYTDLKVRKILRERLAEESRQEQVWIDRNQRDLFAQEEDAAPAGIPMDTPQPAEPIPGETIQPDPLNRHPGEAPEAAGPEVEAAREESVPAREEAGAPVAEEADSPVPEEVDGPETSEEEDSTRP